jgi:hypothetical protein
MVTPLQKSFGYELLPNERTMRALDQVREVYGVRKISLNEKARTIQVEYDASRLGVYDVAALLTEAGVVLLRMASNRGLTLP